MRADPNPLVRRVSWAAFLFGLAWLLVVAGFMIADRRVQVEAFGPLPRELGAQIDGALFEFSAITRPGGSWDRILIDGLYIELATQERTENHRNTEWIPFGYRTWTDPSDPDDRLTVAKCPSWLVGLLLVAPLSASTVWRFGVRFLRNRRACCLTCGYRLQGLSSEKCPECGLVFSGDRWWALRCTSGKPSRWRRQLYWACALTLTIPAATAIGVLLSTIRYEWQVEYGSRFDAERLIEVGIGRGVLCWMTTDWGPFDGPESLAGDIRVRIEVSRPAKVITYLKRPFDWALLLRYPGGRHLAIGAVPLELVGVIAGGWLLGMWRLHRLIQEQQQPEAALSKLEQDAAQELRPPGGN